MSYPVSERPEANSRIIHEILNDVGVRPSRPDLSGMKRLRKVPVVNGHHGLNSLLKESVNQLVIVGDPCLVDAVLGTSFGQNSRPRDGETIVGNL